MMLLHVNLKVTHIFEGSISLIIPDLASRYDSDMEFMNVTVMYSISVTSMLVNIH